MHKSGIEPESSSWELDMLPLQHLCEGYPGIEPESDVSETSILPLY